jgi:hypothetical protein
MKDWRWAQLGRFGGMVVSTQPISLSVQWPRTGGMVAQWWVAGRFVRNAEVGVA